MARTMISRIKRDVSKFRHLAKSVFGRSVSPSAEKNSRIAANIQAFVSTHGSISIPPREVEIAPEIIIPCYNQGRYLADALLSVRWNGQVIPTTIVNDASTDDTLAYIEKATKEHEFKLINNSENLNQSGSINKAIEESKNNLFIILNADDCLMPYTVSTILDLIERNQETRLLGGRCIPFYGENMVNFAAGLPRQLDYTPPLRHVMPEDARRFAFANDIDMSMSGCAFFKSSWQASGKFYPFEKRICSFDDRDFQIRVACLFPVAVIEEPLAMWRQGSSSGRGQQ